MERAWSGIWEQEVDVGYKGVRLKNNIKFQSRKDLFECSSKVIHCWCTTEGTVHPVESNRPTGISANTVKHVPKSVALLHC